MSAPRRSRSTLIVLLLVATLAMTAMLAYEAHQAARSHRATAENVLRDYSKFAAWELARLGRQQLLSAVQHGLSEVQGAASRGNLAAAIGPSTSCPSGCTPTHQVLSAFTMSLPRGELVVAGAPLDERARAVLTKASDDGLRDPRDFTCPAMTVVQSGADTSVVVWRPVHGRGDAPVGVVGFVADRAFVAQTFQRLLRSSPLLPPSLVPKGTDPNGALTVRIASADGHEILASGRDWSPYEASDRLTRDFGGLQLSVALRPDAAEKLVIGGLPRERLPLVVGLLTLTAGLVVVALVQLRREAELARMRSDFVSGVSHELRTPLAQIRMFTETLLLGRIRSAHEGRRSLEIISRETQRLIQLVENVLLFSRGERRATQVVRQRALLAPIVEDVVESFTPLAAARQARISLDVDHSVSAEVDAGALRQILLNLLDNAVKYGAAGQTVRVVLAHDGSTARLAVEDEGPGIAPRDAARIWQPFTRLSTRETATGGAGIGLSIVRQLAELHGGRASVERGRAGARFVIDLPGARSEAGAVTAVA